MQVGRYRQRFPRQQFNVHPAQRPGQLKTIEQIPARGLEQPPDGEPRKAVTSRRPDRRLVIGRRQRTYPQVPDMPCRQPRSHHRHRLRARPDPDRRQQPDRLVPQPPQGVAERHRARTIKPLKIINSDNHRALSGQTAHHPEERGAHGSVLQRAARRILQQQRHLQSILLRRRQLGEHPLENPVHQITKRRERQRRLRFGRTARQDQVRARDRVGYPGRPHRRLADPSFSFKQESRRPRRQPIQEGSHRAELATAPEHTAGLGHGCLLRQVTGKQYERPARGRRAWLAAKSSVQRQPRQRHPRSSRQPVR
jgi:hypothetical protein